MKKIVLIIFSLSLLLSSCGSSKKAVIKPASEPIVKDSERVKPEDSKVLIINEEGQTTVISSNKNNTTLEYINQYAAIAKKEMKEHHIPASITIAQGILESNNGNGDLTRKSNNHFGIKCHRGWKGPRTYHDDDEKGECFRVYTDPATSYKDHSAFLAGRKRYASLFELKKDDYKAWAHGLRMAGYATDNRYPQKLISIIERYKLYRLDSDVITENKKEEKLRNTITHTVHEGETLFAISRKYRISCSSIKTLNKLDSNTIYIDQVLLIKPKSINNDLNVNEEIIFDVNDTINIEKPIVKSIKKTKKEDVKKPVIKTEVKESVSKIVEQQTTKNKTVPNNNVAITTTVPKQSNISVPKVASIEKVEHVKRVKGENQTSYVRTIEAKRETAPRYHTVEKGETLYGIAYKYGLEIPVIRKLNGISKNEISVGQKLKLKNKTEVVVIEPEIILTYTVQTGDTLYKISREQGISLMHLKKINNLKSNNLKVGQILRVN